MNNLKTLKDFKVGLYIADDGAIMASALKQGLKDIAIEHYKNEVNKEYHDESKPSYEWIEEFFDLTEEDLE